jgi:prepilin-type N-terminal cleavage/methylation domain-containing protein/prepilin-type processing-associated H-X9-DG protein
MTKKKRAGFTLIELLVVIAIIAILAAILFPVFLRAKTESKRSVDLESQRQLGMGLCLYADDFDGTFPWTSRARTKYYFPAYPDDFNTTISGELIILLKPYVKSVQVHYCAAVDTYSKECVKGLSAGSPNYMEYTYAWQKKLKPPFMYTGFYYYGGQGWAGSKPTKQNGNPGRILISCIGGGVGLDANQEGSSGHGKARGIYTFADGHAKYIKHYNYPYSYGEVGIDSPKLLMPKWSDR